jgi:hypothetical protein
LAFHGLGHAPGIVLIDHRIAVGHLYVGDPAMGVELIGFLQVAGFLLPKRKPRSSP